VPGAPKSTPTEKPSDGLVGKLLGGL
jgi:hypothetical protein